MNKAKQALKFLTVNSMIGTYVAHASTIRLIHGKGWKTKKKTADWLQKYARFGLNVMGIKHTADGEPISDEPQLYVGNHLSYLDILIFSAHRPTCFVTSQEIRETPVLGFLCDVAGCLFVERRSREHLSKEVAEISEALKNGCNVVIYPEATSTNGDSVLRFKRPLFQSAIDAEAKVRPFTLNYEKIEDEPVSPKNRDLIFWYGDMDFVPHLWDFCGTKESKANVTFHQPLDTKEVTDVTDLAASSHEAVSHSFVSMN